MYISFLCRPVYQVCDEKEAVKDELDHLKSEVEKGGGGGAGEGGGGAMADQITHLQAQNTALVKSMQGMGKDIVMSCDIM